MKRIGILILLSTFAVTLSAQSETQTVELQEVEVKAAKVIHKPDGQIIYPTETQKNASHSGYSILQKLSLPNIRVWMRLRIACRLSTGGEASSCASTALS